MTDLSGWLDTRRPPPPASLRRAVDAAMAQWLAEPAGRADAGAGALVDRLAGAGLAALRRIAAAPSTRSRAIELLAADALITYACEAAVEAEAQGEAGAVERLAHLLGPDRFAQLLQPDTSE